MTKFREWGDIEREFKERGLIDEDEIARYGKEMFTGIRAHRLPELRRAHGITQVQLAERLGVSQARISSIERGELDRTLLGTLEGYVNALGGKLRIVADIDDASFTIHEGLLTAPPEGHAESESNDTAA